MVEWWYVVFQMGVYVHLSSHQSRYQACSKSKKESGKPMDPNRKAEQTIRRMCTKNPRTGKRKLSESVAKQFFNGGDSRKDLIALFVKNGGCKESQSNLAYRFSWVPLLGKLWQLGLRIEEPILYKAGYLLKDILTKFGRTWHSFLAPEFPLKEFHTEGLF